MGGCGKNALTISQSDRILTIRLGGHPDPADEDTRGFDPCTAAPPATPARHARAATRRAAGIAGPESSALRLADVSLPDGPPRASLLVVDVPRRGHDAGGAHSPRGRGRGPAPGRGRQRLQGRRRGAAGDQCAADGAGTTGARPAPEGEARPVTAAPALPPPTSAGLPALRQIRGMVAALLA